MTVRMNPIRLTYLPPPLADVRTYSKLSGSIESSEGESVRPETTRAGTTSRQLIDHRIVVVTVPPFAFVAWDRVEVLMLRASSNWGALKC